MDKIDELKKLPDESENQYIWRVGKLIDSGRYKDWKEITPIINEQWRDDETHFRDESAYRKKYKNAKDFYEGVFSEWKDDAYIRELDKQKRELQKERYKFQAEKLEFNKWMREDAREELFVEKLIDAIRSSKTDCSNIRPLPVERKHKEHCLLFADTHFGKEFQIFGLHNEIINEYNPEIFYSRMEVILAEALDYISSENVTFLKVINLGDTLDGFIRHSQLWSLRFGVVDSAVIYGKYMADWFKRLSEKTFVEYHSTTGNHGELRLLDGRKGEHLHENIENIVNEIISIRNESNPNFKFISNKTGFVFTNVAGYNLLGIHGEVKDATQALKDFSDIYDVKIDIIATGHKHHGNLVNCGYRKQAIGIGSIVGSDDFSMKIRKQADATANIITFESGKGKVNDRTIVLN